MENDNWTDDIINQLNIPNREKLINDVKKMLKGYKTAGYTKNETELLVIEFMKDGGQSPVVPLFKYWINEYWDEV